MQPESFDEFMTTDHRDIVPDPHGWEGLIEWLHALNFSDPTREAYTLFLYCQQKGKFPRLCQ